jgi:hypothetical protein
MQKTARRAFYVKEDGMLSLDAMRKLRDAYNPYAGVSELDVLAEIGNPTRDEIIDTALQGLQSDDRNVRVVMLRVLRCQSGAKAMCGILTGLTDAKRRVREVAIKGSLNYRDHPEVALRLKAIITDDGEKRKIRRRALDALAGGVGVLVQDLTGAAADALGSLAQMPQYRFDILFGLLSLDLNERVEELLREFVKEGTKEEAVMATRALCGYRVVHIDILESDKATQERIRETCEIALGRAWYWVKRDEYAVLTGGPPSPMAD